MEDYQAPDAAIYCGLALARFLSAIGWTGDPVPLELVAARRLEKIAVNSR